MAARGWKWGKQGGVRGGGGGGNKMAPVGVEVEKEEQDGGQRLEVGETRWRLWGWRWGKQNGNCGDGGGGNKMVARG